MKERKSKDARICRFTKPDSKEEIGKFSFNNIACSFVKKNVREKFMKDSQE